LEGLWIPGHNFTNSVLAKLIGITVFVFSALEIDLRIPYLLGSITVFKDYHKNKNCQSVAESNSTPSARNTNGRSPLAYVYAHFLQSNTSRFGING
jgi:hypothetical protein